VETLCVTYSTTSEPALLDICELLAPIPGEDPAGDERAYAHGLRDQLTELRREEHAEDYDDATRPSELKHADWDGVVQTASEALTNTTKDLRVACHLIEALTKLRGFVGLHEGLALLRHMIDECWDRLNPRIDDGDLDARAAPLVNMLDDSQRGVCFPLTVQMIPLVGTGKNSYGLIQWNRAKQKRDAKTDEELARAIVDTTTSDLESVRGAIDDCEEELSLLLLLLDEKLGADSPALTNLRESVHQCGQLVKQGFQHGVPEEHPGTSDAADDELHADFAEKDAVCLSATATDQAILTRSEAYSQLKQASETLERLEPHSPIPYLVKRAVQLGSLPFPKLIEQLIRDGSVLDELGREFGLNTTNEE
jgi:type VI secretion system protein ImpA